MQSTILWGYIRIHDLKANIAVLHINKSLNCITMISAYYQIHQYLFFARHNINHISFRFITVTHLTFGMICCICNLLVVAYFHWQSLYFVETEIIRIRIQEFVFWKHWCTRTILAVNLFRIYLILSHNFQLK